MTPGARVAAAADLLDDILGGAPAEKALTGWARGHRFAGSKDRAAIRDLVYDALRRRRSLAALGGAETGRGLMIGLARESGRDAALLFDGVGYGPAPLSEAEAEAGRTPLDGPEALDCPDWLWPDLQDSLGADAAAALAALRERAPVHLRVNTRRTTVDEAQAQLAAAGTDTRRHPLSATALEVVTGARRLRADPAVLSGALEFQDAASQAVSDLVPLPEGGRLLDYCAGGGGKTLAIGARVKGHFVAHDAAPRRMADLPARAARAGLAVHCAAPDALAAEAPFDTVLVDAPCSGSGSWRRDPQGKWTLDPARLDELTALQDEILVAACGHVAQGGSLCYVTCSLLARENEARIAAFLSAMPGWTCRAQHRFTPANGGDGFFFALLGRDVDTTQG